MRTKLILALLIGAVAVSAAVLLLQGQRTRAPVARITRDGVLLEEIDLEETQAPRSFLLEDERGRNLISVEQGRIRVLEADCPDQICVDQGWISDGTVPIVCLPHRLMIQIVGGEEGLDGGAG
ncbi:NusG domain II-containing protein [bacterium 1xD42-67]|nr:NusG domain II-containing protein [bacterium 1xD42-67]